MFETMWPWVVVKLEHIFNTVHCQILLMVLAWESITLSILLFGTLRSAIFTITIIGSSSLIGRERIIPPSICNTMEGIFFFILCIYEFTYFCVAFLPFSSSVSLRVTKYPDSLRSALLWVITQCIVAIPYWNFGTMYRSLLLLADGTDRL